MLQMWQPRFPVIPQKQCSGTGEDKSHRELNKMRTEEERKTDLVLNQALPFSSFVILEKLLNFVPQWCHL